LKKTDRLYRNLRHWVTLDELDIEIHLVKEGIVLSPKDLQAHRIYPRSRQMHWKAMRPMGIGDQTLLAFAVTSKHRIFQTHTLLDRLRTVWW
jgi:hypothetical protein